MTPDTRIRWVAKPIVWLLCLAPLGWLGWLFYSGGTGANPIEFTNRFLGDWALRLLLIALAVTPLRALTGINQLQRFRRLLGLFAFFYVVLHVTSYVVLDNFFDWKTIWEDIIKRWYITVGMAGLLALTPLAVTSTQGWIKRLGKNWVKLHRFVYFAGAAGCLHFFMMRKGFQYEPLVYAGILAVLLGWRVAQWMKKKRARRPAAA